MQIKRLKLWLLALVALAALVRFTGLDWDQNHHFHPDERRIYVPAEEIPELVINAFISARGIASSDGSRKCGARTSTTSCTNRATSSCRGCVYPTWRPIFSGP